MEMAKARVDGLGLFIASAEELFGFDPCPFCGGGKVGIYEAKVEWLPGRLCKYGFTLRCDCGVQLEGNVLVYPGEDKDGEVVEAARAVWNRRRWP